MNTRILILTAALFAALATPARAGSYVVVGCSDLGGSTPRSTDGWYLAAGVYPSGDQCNVRGGLYATGDRAPNLFRFDAPPSTTIARLVSTYRAHLSGAASWAVPTFVVEAGHGAEWEYISPARGSISAEPIELAGDRASGDAHGADALRIGVRCELAGPCTTGGQPWARFYALAVELTDSRAPAVGLTAPGGHLRGSVEIGLAARDEGGGVYERRLDLDGRQVGGARLCATLPATLGARRHVTARVPCPLDASTATRLDTRAIADGAHTLAARVEDVAGNARTAAARIVVDNRPPRAGTVALTGDPAEALTAQPRGFAGEDVAYDYRWERCDGAGCTEIGAAVSRAYSVRPRDAGHRLRAVVSATDGGGTVRVASPQSAPVPGAAGAPTAAPVDAGEPRARLTAWLERAAPRLRPTPSGWAARAVPRFRPTPSGWAAQALAGLRRVRARPAAHVLPHLRHATVTWPTRVRVRGRLTDLAGRPLGHAPVRVLERIAGGHWHAITGVRTRRDGRLTTFTGIGPSRRLRLVYGSATASLRLTVRASVRLRIRRRGRLTLVSGRVRGGRVPRAGLRVLLQSAGLSGWRTRATLRSDGLGRFSASGRAPAGARLRVVVPAQRGYPFARGVGGP